ncbi:MAG TPA: hypothetical protein PKN36_01155 [bacterium]|nr:hypothetical protein [bacterium]
MGKIIRVIWHNAPDEGSVEVIRGTIESIHIASGKGRCKGNSFSFNPGPASLDVMVSDAMTMPGAFATIVRIRTKKNPFSFFLRDALNSSSPVWIPEYGVAVLKQGDNRSYEDISGDIMKMKIPSDFSSFEDGPEENFENAACRNRKNYAPTWLGISKDMRIFRFGYQDKFNFFGKISSCFLSHHNKLWDSQDLLFAMGQGLACRYDISRRLEEGYMPILRAVQREKFMHYHVTAFASLEKGPLEKERVRGTHWLAAYANSAGNKLSREDIEKMQDFIDKEMYFREEEVVLCCKVEAVNKGRSSCYAWFKSPYFRVDAITTKDVEGISFEPKNGLTLFKGSILSLTRFNQQPMPQQEMAVLLEPGEKAVFEMFIPHSPLSIKRLRNLDKMDFDRHLEGARSYWKEKVESAASFSIPEKKIDEAVKAGLLHLDITTLGKEPDDTVAPHAGMYSPIGTESAPIMQYFDSVGWHNLAKRSVQFFFERQREDGFMQNCGRYESETGPVLWTAGEHYRHTGDKKWLKESLPNMKKAVEYLLKWREKNKTQDAAIKGFRGMLDGKVADPDDFYHSFFLNAGTYLGLKRIAEITKEVDPEYSSTLKTEVKKYLKDIRNGFYHAMANAPVVPVGDGSWAPFTPPWVEQNGNITFYADGGNWFSHAAFACRGVLTGPLWLIIGEVLSPEEIGSHFLLKHNQFPVTLDNAALSQPYYSRHDFAHLKRGEVKAFLKCYYNQLTALMDRETYTFWEHYCGSGQHKTHEEAWFLMQTRWMLYMEDGDTLNLFTAIPRKWLENGKKIEVKNASSYFGPISFYACSDIDNSGSIIAGLELQSGIKPRIVRIRIPHPEGRKAIAVEGGKYCPETETVEIIDFKSRSSIHLFY